MTPFLRNLQIETKKSGEIFRCANFVVRADGSFITCDTLPNARRIFSAIAMNCKISGKWTRTDRRNAAEAAPAFAEDHRRLP